jgi:hypothetical protein
MLANPGIEENQNISITVTIDSYTEEEQFHNNHNSISLPIWISLLSSHFRIV